MSEPINTSPAAQSDIICMNRVTFSPIMRFWLDEEKTQPEVLTGRFDLEVRNQANEVVLDFSTVAPPGGITIQNTNELAFLKTATEMNIPSGIYKYNLQQTVGAEVIAIAFGDFIVKNNTNPIPATP